MDALFLLIPLVLLFAVSKLINVVFKPVDKAINKAVKRQLSWLNI